jgi:hypothetical protein
LYLVVGTVDGLLVRVTIDLSTGQLSDTRIRYGYFNQIESKQIGI